MELVIVIPETAEIPATEFLEAAAKGYGWSAEAGITAEQAILDALEYDLLHRFRAGATDRSRDEVEAELPIPESRGQRAHREREALPEAEPAGEEVVR